MIDPIANFRNFLGVQSNSGLPAGPGARARAEAATVSPISSPANSSPGRSANAANASAAPGFMPFHSGSVVDRLPPAAREIMRGFEEEAEAASVIHGSLFDRQQEALIEKQKAEARVRKLRSRHGLQLHDDDPALASALATADKARAEWQRLNDEMSRRSEAARPTRELLANLRGYVERELASVAVIEPAAPVAAPALKAGEQWAEAIKRQRAKIAKLHDDLQGVIDAPQPSSIAKQIAVAEIEALAAKGRPGVAGLIDGARQINWPGNVRLAEVALGQDGRPIAHVGHDRRDPDGLALVAWLHKDELIAAVCAEIDEAADDASALEPATRQKKVGQLDDAILQAERLEEVLVVSAAKEGVTIMRRPDADARAVLGLADHMPSPRRSF